MKEFWAYRELAIAKEFNLKGLSQRILNADGASWIRKIKAKSPCSQLDLFHRNKVVKEKIHEKATQEAIFEPLMEENVEGLLRHLNIYHNRLSEDDEIEDAEESI